MLTVKRLEMVRKLRKGLGEANLSIEEFDERRGSE